MKLLRLRSSSVYFNTLRSYCDVSFKNPESESFPKPSINKLLHCYKTLYPWDNFDEFTKYLISSIEFNNDGLLVLNKPYGVKIHGHDKPGARQPSKHQFVKSTVPECDYTVEDALSAIQEHFNLPKLSIVKSAEKYTSGVVLISSSDEVTKKIKKAFNTAKSTRKPHLVHWAVTLGYPTVPYRKERAGIKFIDSGKDGLKLPVVETGVSLTAAKKKKIHPVLVESRTISVNEEVGTSLVEITSSSVQYHFVRVYASSFLAPILGDILYGYRVKKLLGVPIQIHPTNLSAAQFEPIPPQMSKILNLPKDSVGQLMIPTMLHLRGMILPNYLGKNKDYLVTTSLPPHFKWTVERLNLLHDCINK